MYASSSDRPNGPQRVTRMVGRDKLRAKFRKSNLAYEREAVRLAEAGFGHEDVRSRVPLITRAEAKMLVLGMRNA